MLAAQRPYKILQLWYAVLNTHHWGEETKITGYAIRPAGCSGLHHCSLPYSVNTSFPHGNTHTHLFNGPLSGTTRVSRYQKGTEARDSEWQWHPLGHMQVCTSLQTDNHASTPPLSFLQAGCPSWHPTNSVKARKASLESTTKIEILCSF